MIGLRKREEPALTHGLLGPPALRAALAAWRRERLALASPPWLLVLSSGRGLDPAHPAFRGPARPLLFVPAEAAAELRERFAAIEVRVASLPQPSARLALDHLRRLGAKRITLEAGPTTTRDLYGEPARVDELWLSTYVGKTPPSEGIGKPFVADARIVAALPHASAPCVHEEPGGSWRFERRAAR